MDVGKALELFTLKMRSKNWSDKTISIKSNIIMKIQSNFKFDPLDKKRWQECADKKTRGNLSQWIEMELNKSSDKILGKRKELDKDQ